MKVIKLYLTLFFVSSLFFACNNHDSDESLIGKWEVMKLYDDILLKPQFNNSYIFEFQNDTLVMVKLDVNICYGGYNESCDDCIEFDGFGCTEACCDSEYAEDLIRITSESSEYDIDGDQLTLEGSGKVVFKKIK